MRVVMYEKYGPPEVLQVGEIQKPVPTDNEVLIKIHATTVTTGDVRLRSLNVPTGFRTLTRIFFGMTGPRKKVLGVELAGEIVEVGRQVKEFKAGDRVFGSGGSGAYAEYLAMPAKGAITTMPGNLSYQEAAAVPFGSLSSLTYLRDFGKIKSGQKVLINGASGCLGTFAVQLARHFEAEVTAVCSTSNLEWVKSLGADRVVDYTREDFTKRGEVYDIIFDTVGKITFSGCRRALKEDGRFLLAVAGVPQFLQALWTGIAGRQKVVAGVANFTKENLVLIKDLIEEGKIKPVIDRSYPLEQMAEAHSYVDQGHKKGNVVITVSHDAA